MGKGKRLLVVSDTAMWDLGNKKVAFEPVIRELESIYSMVDSITWIGYQQSNADVKKYAREANIPIRYVMLKQVGGATLFKKLQAVLHIPIVLWIVFREIFRHDLIHSRAPSLPAYFAMLFSKFDSKRKYWHKYAGNWAEENPPYFYGLQRTVLRKLGKQNIKGTINGNWPGQEPHLLSFENPCLFESEIEQGLKDAKAKAYSTPLTICFVGALVKAKGVHQLIQSLSLLKHPEGIAKLVMVGDGVEREQLEIAAQTSPVKVEFKGFLTRDKIAEVYSQSDALMLPSDTEGFPKVIAEGAGFGCIPMVTDISSLSQYITHGKNGYLLPTNTKEEIAKALDLLVETGNRKEIGERSTQMAERFTYEFFHNRIKEEVFQC